MNKESIILVDGNYLLIRTFFGAMNSPFEVDVVRYAWGIIIHKILNLIYKFKTFNISICLDGSRSKIKRFKETIYKSKRVNKLPEEFNDYYSKIYMILEVLSIPIIRFEDLEADDIMASIAHFNIDNRKIFFFTEDKDMYQTLNNNTRIIKYNFEILEQQNILDKLELSSIEQMVDYYSLVGDTADGLSGVRGIGKKTASRLLAKYGTLHNILLAVVKQEKNFKYAELFKRSVRELILTRRLILLNIRDLISVDLKSNIALKDYNRVLLFLNNNQYFNCIELFKKIFKTKWALSYTDKN